MLDTPSGRFKLTANRGAFDRFPVDPTPYADAAYSLVEDIGPSAFRATEALEDYFGELREALETPAGALARDATECAGR